MGRKRQSPHATFSSKAAAVRSPSSLKRSATRETPPPSPHEGVTRPAMAKLARRGGLERVPQVARDLLTCESDYLLYLLLRGAIVIAKSNSRRKLTRDDVVLSARVTLGRELLGFRTHRRRRRHRQLKS